MSEADKNRKSEKGSRPVDSKTPPPPIVGKGKGPPAPAAPPNLFRRIDWTTAGITALLVLIGYVITLAPDLTLEDSGELAVGSFYAGVPHPPGYPVWTLYTWLFTVLFPVSNIAYRVAMSSAVAGAVSCGLLALMVSRGSSMILEGIEEFKSMDKKWEGRFCLVAGVVSGLLLGFNGFMWSQAVIVEVYTFSLLSLIAVLCLLLRWMYAPHQLRFLYWAMFMFGICITNHQTLIVAAMGIEVAILCARPKLGRDLFLVNTIIYVLVLFGKSRGIVTSFDGNDALLNIFHLVGVGSLITCVITAFKTEGIGTEYKPVLIMALVWAIGAGFYFYMPLASMSNPPMNWGYPRTAEGFWHALTRGQYDKTNPTDVLGHPFQFFDQIRMYVEGASEEYTSVFLLVALVPFVYYRKMQKRERAWMIGLTSIWICLTFLLLILLNPKTDRQSREQSRVFFVFSHLIVSLAIGYGLAIIGALLTTSYKRFRVFFIGWLAVASAFALYSFFTLERQFALDHYTALLFVATFVLLLIMALMATEKIPLGAVAAVFLTFPAHSILLHWADNEQHGHLFGYWFGHDMFTPPFGIYPEMARDSILFGGTDPGRFCPTYMIFDESFIPPSKKPLDPKFDRRDVYIITQNALADGTYLSYIRAHYNRSTQIDPPFFQDFFRSAKEFQEGTTNAFARMWQPVDHFFTALGKRIEDRRRAEGVYPPKEIQTPSPADSQICFAQYIEDAQKRLQHDIQAPNEPKQIHPGEDVKLVDGRISVSGQVAVMAINGLLTKIIFDKNPTHEFYVEESFPLDWMYQYLTPSGIIMKINREPVHEMTDEMVRKDHDFWSRYSERLIGNWITYDTPVKQICEFAERTYLHRDFTGFKGDPKFIRDDNGQKAFSKLRSAIAGLYFWRLSNTKRPAENQRMIKECEFALKQAVAFCPYSPEAVFKYVNLLANLGRIEDAKLVVNTCIKFDPENDSMRGLAQNLEDIQHPAGAAQQPAAQNASQVQVQLSNVEAQWMTNQTNLQLGFTLASLYLQAQKSNEALAVLAKLASSPTADGTTLLSVAQAYAQLRNGPGLVNTLQRLHTLMPGNPEVSYDLSRAYVMVGMHQEGLKLLDEAIKASNLRLKTQPTAKNLAQEAQADATFAPIKDTPEFKKLLQ